MVINYEQYIKDAWWEYTYQVAYAQYNKRYSSSCFQEEIDYYATKALAIFDLASACGIKLVNTSQYCGHHASLYFWDDEDE